MSQDVAARFREYMFLQRKRDADGLSVSEAQRYALLKGTLNKHFQPHADSGKVEKRESVRLPSRLRLRYASVSEIGQSLMMNVSRGGIFVATDSPLAIGSKVTLWIEIDEGGTELELVGEVVSQNVAPDMLTERRGMGLRFGTLDPASQKIVDDLYQRCANRALAGS